MKRVLFILKYRESDYGSYNADPTVEKKTWAYTQGLSSGLLNSAKFVCDMLSENLGYESKLVQVYDNNDIDREVTAYKPTHVIIEAYWVVPEKFDILTKLHPNVIWIIRNHSNTPFLANEGIAFGWTMRYLQYPNVHVSCNHPKALREMRLLAWKTYPFWDKEFVEKKVNYLPNYYPLHIRKKEAYPKNKDTIDIGCFGAIRPLKNHMIQAVAAIEFAHKKKKKLRFHINGNRLEGKGEPILKNLREIFDHVHDCELIEHPWMNHDDFLKLVRSMDIGLQVSFSETFNIVAADFINCDVPIVTCREIDWSNKSLWADPTDSQSIVSALDRAFWYDKHINFYCPHVSGIKRYNRKSVCEWDYVISTTNP